METDKQNNLNDDGAAENSDLENHPQTGAKIDRKTDQKANDKPLSERFSSGSFSGSYGNSEVGPYDNVPAASNSEQDGTI